MHNAEMKELSRLEIRIRRLAASNQSSGIDCLDAILRESNANSRTAQSAAADGGAPKGRILDLAFLSRPAPPSKQ